MCMSEIMTIIIYFHLSNIRTFKQYYLGYVSMHLKEAFPELVSYNRFVELMKTVLVPLTIFLKTCRLGEVTGISFVDSTSIKVCHNKRIVAYYQQMQILTVYQIPRQIFQIVKTQINLFEFGKFG